MEPINPSESACDCPPRFVDTPQGLLVAAPAKINLNLLVGPRRIGGYHPLDSYVCKVTLFDTVLLSPIDRPGTQLECYGADCGPVEKNLAYRAAELIAHATGRRGVAIGLDKRIPPGMGLGGGSSDAAAVLVGLNRLWNLKLSDVELQGLGAQLGSDVPLFIGPACSRMTGRGEILEPATIHKFHAVLVLPEFGCATAQVYEAFDELPQEMAPQLEPDVLASQKPSQWRARLVNQLERPARAVSPGLGGLLERLGQVMPVPVHMTGSGSAVFLLCDDAREAVELQSALPMDVQPRSVRVTQCDW